MDLSELKSESFSLSESESKMEAESEVKEICVKIVKDSTYIH